LKLIRPARHLPGRRELFDMSDDFFVPYRLKQELLPVLEAFATYGAARVDSELQAWVRNSGVAETAQSGEWMAPSRGWIEDVLPAGNSLDLLRRTVLLLPSYRAHLDIVLCAVLHAVGSSERWARFEELLFGPYAPFAQRFAALLEWQEREIGVKAVELGQHIWQEADRKISSRLLHTFSLWDEELWGASGNPNLLFPLLDDLYLPLIESPIYLAADTDEFPDETTDIITGLINAAKHGEGVLLPMSVGIEESARLIPLGLPVRLLPSPAASGYCVLGLTGRVTLRRRDGFQVAEPAFTPMPEGVPFGAQRSDFCESSLERPPDSMGTFWEVADDQKAFSAFISIDRKLDRWPANPMDEAPPWSRIPIMETLGAVGKPRRLSPEADEALLAMGNHTLYGFLLQLLLLEALDRELGEETLVLAPPIDRKVQDLEGATVVLYRCRLTANPPREIGRRPLYELGSLDSVLDRLSSEIGILRVCRPYMEEDAGPWSRSLRMLRSAQIVIARHDRWCIAPEVLDRLHGGGLMTQIIRRGRLVREKLHATLEALWIQRHADSNGV
jgi:hypothetical protein